MGSNEVLTVGNEENTLRQKRTPCIIGVESAIRSMQKSWIFYSLSTLHRKATTKP